MPGAFDVGLSCLILYYARVLRLLSTHYQKAAGLDLKAARESKYSTREAVYFHVDRPQCFYF